MQSPNNVTKEDLSQNTTCGLCSTTCKLFNWDHTIVVGLIHHALRKDQLIQPVKVRLKKTDGPHLLKINITELLL